ncbi:hypothetical protein HYPSUDRAFT_150548 [Hypholoma sublateritium FD-334 SS-4]|uniref:Uncharacterized protein n=1 Tax=Hypholoma sublateritium (strain FD-334 SS-4) TaxID=945553 RepID=A0A0D2N5A1_HYPSF|nr:hypothetical protein HYPSUDRAFT_150548 [Hypholoma sublateritium FD-334 SS-4]
MHLGTFNLADLFLSLWRGTVDHDADDPPSSWPWAVLIRNIWETHGKDVASATPYLPGSFDRPPRNIAEKINSGYKAWEWLLYLYGLAPALLYGILPEPYYSHFCRLVRAMRIIHQHNIRADDLRLAGDLFKSFVEDFEAFYYQRKVGRLHFCRQSIHALLHLAPEVTRIGPPICSSQWTMERTIGNLGEEIRQPSNPYANLSQRGLLRCQVNALTAMIPDLCPPPTSLPRGAIELGQGYILLRAQDRYERLMHPQEVGALLRYLGNTAAHRSSVNSNWCPKVTRWARLRLPNGQVARSHWKESLKPLGKLRTARNVKFTADDGSTRFGEVLYYFRCRRQHAILPLAILSVYSEPDLDLLTASHGTVISCKHLRGDSAIQVIDVFCIQSVIAMVPHKLEKHGVEEQYYFLVERPGLDVVRLGGGEENLT